MHHEVSMCPVESHREVMACTDESMMPWLTWFIHSSSHTLLEIYILKTSGGLSGGGSVSSQ